MPVTLTVNNQSYEYPIPGDSPGWGEAATGWAEQVTLALNDLQGITDISQKTFNILNNISTFTDVSGLSFNTSLNGVLTSFNRYNTGVSPTSYELLDSRKDPGGFGPGTVAQVNVSAVPEPATWGMMLFGFGIAGFSLRRRKRSNGLLQAA